ncbi:DUF72 domain-containing protein [Dactylosporangium sp. NPDC005572]|uniref:DUF72 domain-containing protein n=1 Tax=Dactylosporangium sp. NPDC005572 TaxID=3156889 RepID=UPI0033BA1382
MGVIRLGTSSWADRQLLTSGWYPRSVRTPAGRLAHYASRFDLVEADTSFHAIPAPETTAAWAAATPDGFTFDVKAFGLLTGHPTRLAALPSDLRPDGVDVTIRLRRRDLPEEAVEELWHRFHQALDPLDEAGRLGTVVLAFPSWLAHGPAATRRVLDTIERCAHRPAAVELRHTSWFEGTRATETLRMLQEAGAAYVCVDTPLSPPPLLAVTAEPAVVRFHGHEPGPKEFTYSDRELQDWAARLHHLSADAEELHVLMNTCCAGQAQRDGERLAEFLAASAPRRGLRAV